MQSRTVYSGHWSVSFAIIYSTGKDSNVATCRDEQSRKVCRPAWQQLLPDLPVKTTA